ncbi:MAG: ArnT family glycosyltransferase [Calditrichia bacterium]
MKNAIPYRIPILTVLLFLYLLLLSFANGHIGLSYDEAHWTYMGQQWLEGDLVLYKEAVDNKQPAIFLLFGLCAFLVGPGFILPRIIGSLALALAGLLVYRIARLIHDERAGLISFLLYACSVSWVAAGWRFTAQTESFVVLFSTLAVYLLLRGANKGVVSPRTFLAAGLIIGLALAFKQSAVFGLLVLFVAVFLSISKNRLQAALLIFGSAVAIPLLLLLIPFLQGAELSEIADQLLTASTIGKTNSLQERWTIFYSRFMPQNVRLVVFIIGIAALLVYAGALKQKLMLYFLCSWVALEFIALNIAGNYATYQLRTWLPALSVSAGIGLALTERIASKRWAMDKVSNALIVLVLVIALELPRQSVWALDMAIRGHPAGYTIIPVPHSKPIDIARRYLGEWVYANTSAEQTVYIAGYGAQVQAYAMRKSPTRYFSGQARNVGALSKELSENPPYLVLIPNFREYEEWIPLTQRNVVSELVQRNYVLREERLGYRVYRRNE